MPVEFPIRLEIEIGLHRSGGNDEPDLRTKTDDARLKGADMVAGADAMRGQMVREPVRSLVHLGVGAPLAFHDQVLAGAEVVGGVFEEVSEVVLHHDALYGAI